MRAPTPIMLSICFQIRGAKCRDLDYKGSISTAGARDVELLLFNALNVKLLLFKDLIVVLLLLLTERTVFKA